MRWLFLIALVACKDPLPAADPNGERFATRGKVMKIEADSVDIFHEHIPKIRTVDGTLEPMEPMTMHFSATATAPLTGIAVGDAVAVEFSTHYRTDAVLRLISIQKLPPGTALTLPP